MVPVAARGFVEFHGTRNYETYLDIVQCGRISFCWEKLNFIRALLFAHHVGMFAKACNIVPGLHIVNVTVFEL